MNVFVSAPSADLDLVRAITTKIQDAGHEIHDWTSRVQEEKRMTDDQIVAHFSEGLAAVRNGDMFVLVVTSPRGPSTGCAMELGLAMWFGRDARLLELVEIDESCPWFYHPGRKWFCLRGEGVRFGPERGGLQALVDSLGCARHIKE